MPDSPSTLCRDFIDVKTTDKSCSIIDEVIKGPMPSAKTDNMLKAPPANMSTMPKIPEEKIFEFSANTC